MNNKKLINKLSTVASILSDDEFIRCDFALSSDSIILDNWKGDIVSTVALSTIMQLCEKYRLFFHVDFYLKRVSIYE